MGSISVFNFISLDGFFAGPNGEIDWFKELEQDMKFDKLARRQSQSGGALIFGHTTYEMMKSYWPASEARRIEPEMAEVLNNSPKLVFSKTMKAVKEEPHWKNVRVLHEINKKEIEQMKEQEETDFTLLGSGTIIQQFTDLGLIDEFALAVVPVILGKGKPLFKDVKNTKLELVEAKSFDNGVSFLVYQTSK